MSYATYKPRAPQTTTPSKPDSDGWQTVPSRSAPKPDNDGWQSVPSRRELPSSFQSRRPPQEQQQQPQRALPSSFQKERRSEDVPVDDRRQTRLDELREASLLAERQARERRVAEEAAARKEADALNFLSTQSYPSLGGGGKTAPPKKPAMNFKRTVEEMVVREEQAAALSTSSLGLDADDYFASLTAAPVVKRVAPKPQDLEEDEEDDYQEEEEDDEGEFNADIHSTRRRGDKGVW